MANLLFANNASAVIASPIGTGATTVDVADASVFPAPGVNEYFIATFVDIATGLIKEIIHVTDVTANTLTIVRAQESTTAKSWNVGDVCAMFWTAGCAQAMLQQSQQQSQATNFAVDTGVVNQFTIALSPAPSALSAILGAPIRVTVAHTTNSTSVSLNVNGLGGVSVRMADGTLPGVGYFVLGALYEFIWNGGFFCVTNALSPATSAQVIAGTDDVHHITSLALRAAMANSIVGGSLPITGYQKLPTGLIIQWGRLLLATGNGDTITFPTAFPTQLLTVTASGGEGTNAQPSVINSTFSGASSFTAWCYKWNGSAFAVQSGAGVGWIALGY